jgi:hypothetical protein
VCLFFLASGNNFVFLLYCSFAHFFVDRRHWSFVASSRANIHSDVLSAGLHILPNNAK